MDDLLVTFITVTVLVLLLVCGIFISFIIAARQRVKQQMLLAETHLRYERELRTVESEVTESVMTQFSQELHDNIGQMLTALHLQVENFKLDHPELSKDLQPTEIYINEIGQQVRVLSRTLNADYIGSAGLVTAMRLQADRLNALKRMKVHLESRQDVRPGKNEEMMLFRIFQEIAQNALKHAGAKNLFVILGSSGDGFVLQAKDDGKGFDPEEVKRAGKASGLHNILRRAQLAGFLLELDAAPGQGTTYTIRRKSPPP